MDGLVVLARLVPGEATVATDTAIDRHAATSTGLTAGRVNIHDCMTARQIDSSDVSRLTRALSYSVAAVRCRDKKVLCYRIIRFDCNRCVPY